MNKSSESPAVSCDPPSPPRMRSALIAGCGYVGLRVARLWRDRGVNVSAITRSTEKAAQMQAEGINPVHLDLGSSLSWPALPDVDTVFWAVGFDRSPGSDRNATWMDGLQRLLHSMPDRSKPRRILYTSSTGVYGSGHGQEMDETSPPNPDTEGGRACLAAENLLQGFAQRTGHQVFILRLSGIYGPDRLLRRVSELRGGVPLTTAPDEWLNLIHVSDAVRVIDWFASSPAPEAVFTDKSSSTATHLMNVVASQTVTRRTYYAELARLVSAPEPVFADASAQTPGSAFGSTERRRGGNRKVVSLYRATLPVQFEFDDCRTGLADAVEKSSMG